MENELKTQHHVKPRTAMDRDYTWFLGRKMCNTGTSSGKVARYNRDAFKLLYGTDDEFQPGTDVDVAKIYYQQITYKSTGSNKYAATGTRNERNLLNHVKNTLFCDNLHQRYT